MTRILIADDHPFILAGLEALLKGTPFDIVAKAADGRAALAAIEAADPELVLLDVRMPELDGVEVLRTMRMNEDHRPVVLLTANLDDRRLLEALSLEVNGIILKDGAQNLLLHCLEQVASGSKWIEPRLLQQVGVRDAPGEEANDRLRLLSPRERAMAFMAGQGFRNRQIATELGIAEGTVKVSLHRVYEKLGVSSRVELSLLISSVP